MHTARAKLEALDEQGVLEKELIALVSGVATVTVLGVHVCCDKISGVQGLPLNCATDDVAFLNLGKLILSGVGVLQSPIEVLLDPFLGLLLADRRTVVGACDLLRCRSGRAANQGGSDQRQEKFVSVVKHCFPLPAKDLHPTIPALSHHPGKEKAAEAGSLRAVVVLRLSSFRSK